MRVFVIGAACAILAGAFVTALADAGTEDLGNDWLADARKNQNADLEAAILKAIEFLRLYADNVNSNSRIRAYDVVLKASPGREGWDVHMNVDGSQSCKVSLKKHRGKEIELDVLSGCAQDCAHHQKVSCHNI